MSDPLWIKRLADDVASDAPEGWGFLVVLFEVDVAPATVIHFANVERETMIAALRELLNQLQPTH